MLQTPGSLLKQYDSAYKENYSGIKLTAQMVNQWLHCIDQSEMADG